MFKKFVQSFTALGLLLPFLLSAEEPKLPPAPPGFEYVNGQLKMVSPALKGVNSPMRMTSSALSVPSFPGPGDGTGDGSDTNYVWPGYSFPTNGLWLQIFAPTNGAAGLVLHGTEEGKVYGLLSRGDLNLTNWGVEQMLHTVSNETSIAASVEVLAETNAFYWAEDWTGLDVNGNGLPDWWEFEQFGDFDQSAEGDVDQDGVSNYYEFLNGTCANDISFSVRVADNYVSNVVGAVTVDVAKGAPYYVAVCVDGTNGITPQWKRFLDYNVKVQFDSEGWHEVWIGLSGHAKVGAWCRKRLKYDRTPPTLALTASTTSIVDVPMIQIKGYSPEALGSISYDVVNSAGILTNHPAWVTDQFYDTNLCELTTNSFLAVDVPLVEGTNCICFLATDLAGNLTVSNFNFVVDYSGKTNPVVQVTWPLNGAKIAGETFTLRGQVDDPTVGVCASITDSSGETRVVQGLVERNGRFWVENLPVTTGSNLLTLTVTNVAGLSTMIPLSVEQSPVRVTLNPVPGADLWKPIVNVSGTISDSTWSVWVNGVAGINHGNGTWSAQNVPTTQGGVAVFDLAAYPPNEAPAENGNQNATNPPSPNSVATPVAVDKPTRLYVSEEIFRLQQSWFQHMDESDSDFWDQNDDSITVGYIWSDGQESDGYRIDRSQWSFPEYTNLDETIVKVRWDAAQYPNIGSPTYTVRGNDTNNFINPRSPFFMGRFAPCSGRALWGPYACGSGTGHPAVKYGWDAYAFNVNTTMKLDTGGKALSGRQSLFSLSGSANAYHPGDADNDPDRMIGTNVPATDIQIDGKPLGADGKLWRVYPDNITVDVTPKVKNQDYYTFKVSSTKHHCYFTAYAEQPNPEGGRNSIISLTAFSAGHGWWKFSSDAPVAQLAKSGIPLSGLAFLDAEVGYFPLVSLTSIFRPEPGILKNPGNGARIDAQHTFEIGFDDLKRGLSFTSTLSSNPGTYSLYLYPHNCVTTTIEAASAAGVALPNDTTPQNLGIDLKALPNE